LQEFVAQWARLVAKALLVFNAVAQAKAQVHIGISKRAVCQCSFLGHGVFQSMATP